ncbi:MAG: GAF domain-containing protein [Burkholderiales bacterium]|nr:GAF domain-containing protein [Burkholderiales bacterium]
MKEGFLFTRAPQLTPAPVLDNDARRLEALHGLLILDTPPEQRFDRITAFAAEEFEVPIALVSLVDRERQWFKSRVGLEVCETGRDISFCGHAIHGNGIMVVHDARADARFHDNPLVLGPPHVRFYAGAPLVLSGGEAIGTLCLIDRVPRQFDIVDVGILGTLRDLTVAELDWHKRMVLARQTPDAAR